MTSEHDDFEGLLDDVADLIRDGFRRPRVRRRRTMPAPRPREAARSGGEEGRHPVRKPAEAIDAAEASLARIAGEVAGCTKCVLSETRTNTVPGEGAPDPLVLVIGEGPGADEDRTGRPFVGAAGQYLDKWLEAIGLSREANCFIANIVKCRPPRNRDPQPEESAACIPYLERQIDALEPRVILTVGRIAIQNLLGTTRGIGALRGGTYEFRGVPVIPTYHPSGVLRNPDYRRSVWDDLQRLKALLDGADG